ncbi:MAG: carbohydrate kinase family protein [Cyanobacteria bacterium REEB67]|nr:carbohydrate kinase family protein [Cyanobacteria bacterium REEB67]
MSPPNILVIGCASADTIHLENGLKNGLQTGSDKRTCHTLGGAGFYTALAAAHCGAAVTLYAPKPKKLTGNLAIMANQFRWLGPEIDEGDMPRLEIIHHGDDRATLLAASWGAEGMLTTEHLDHMLGEATKLASSVKASQNFDLVHIAALSTVQRQLDFAIYISESLSQSTPPLISAGTYARAVKASRDQVFSLLKKCHFFFMNANEAKLLLADDCSLEAKLRPGQLCFVTDGANGATIYAADEASAQIKKIAVAAQRVQNLGSANSSEPFDPTGAGDTFCGAVLADFLNHKSEKPFAEPIDRLTGAAQRGATLASAVIGQAGSDFYLNIRR